MKYTISLQEGQILLIEKDAEYIPITLDTAPEDKERLSKSIGQLVDEKDFDVMEVEIPGHSEFCQTVAKLK